ncbi:undecaprenyl-diphosphate phosphatase [Lederbergia galactosidilytica]|uniref:Undecaprenyl-diphosphatase n=1 Tax=Lederbergia galactosidilytica TaxID=217031 RepID=A0A0Q9XZ61_9BACI|nr:undecaprenyl-diphosphate phosphatase [Lederbergia galactosidilytica]KRG12372.1 UDP pyrophosphate phosphatase [Virgibacillus soli]KRG12729.1 UDP pyrophosphate phosphatase [Lederbergia galactosidilytica]MBP1913831.1 undecaprenyl-diphosphatase [Lederbergia galactosidilytica]OAK73882.1 UDP pyrophosphate phosphatase [Lederbergia galactosidilytica]
MDIRDWIVALILGFVEGMTEFAPVSSTGHMIIVDDMLFKSAQLLGSQEVANTFKVVIQLGSIMAVVIVFWSRLWSLVGINIGGTSTSTPTNHSRLKLSHVIVGLIPAAVLGLAFEDVIDKYLFRIETVLLALVAGAILMLIADRQSKKERDFRGNSLDEITYRQALLIGLFQCIALWPGFSRSGATISGGVLMGLKHRAAADFTFIMAVPIMFGASAVSLLKKWDVMTLDVLPFFIVGFISAFVFAWVSIRFFLALISRVKLRPFAIYRIILAVVLAIVYYSIG